ncbi:MAG: trehalose-phosphatase [Bryobacteraceae bacterium]
MQYLLSRANRLILERLAQERTLCAFDFDGTLSPIVDHPEGARLRDRTRDLLVRLTELYPCVIISGRARADVLRRLDGATPIRVLGNHGAETESTQPNWRSLVVEWKAALERGIVALPGVWVEDKGISLAVHYRQATRTAEARRRINALTGSLEQARVFGGKKVVNVMVASAPNKGDALRAERHNLGCEWVLYVGDDENDEDAFALDGNLVAVRVGRNRLSRARYYLRNQSEIDPLLESLVRLRTVCRL